MIYEAVMRMYLARFVKAGPEAHIFVGNPKEGAETGREMKKAVTRPKWGG